MITRKTQRKRNQSTGSRSLVVENLLLETKKFLNGRRIWSVKTLLQQLLIPRQSQCTLSKVEKPEFQVSTDITVTKKDRNTSLA